MKNVVYAIIAATLAMTATSGLVALATETRTPETIVTGSLQPDIDKVLMTHLDHVVAIHIAQAKADLGL